MTVSTTTNKIVLTADGLGNTYTFPFAVRAGGSTDIQVFQTTPAGVITQLVYSTQYTVVLNAAIAPNPTPIGGTVTITATPAINTLITILRTMALTQATSLANQGTLYQPVVESMDDTQEMQVQQVSELQGRAIVVAVSDAAPIALPPAAQRANQALVFDASGNPTAGVIPSSGVISSAMAPFVAAATIAAAKALLGYGTMANENIGAAGKGIVDDGAGNARVNQTISAVTTNQSPIAAQHMTNYAASGTIIFTLPKLTTVFNGYELWVFCLTNTSTLSPNAADNFPALGGGVSVVLTAGQCARIIGDGVSGWQIFMGRIPGIGGPTKTVFTTGSAATYTVKAGCSRLQIRAVAGGGGGGSSASGAGGTGGTTTFNSVNAVGGTGGSTPSTSAAGGTGGTGTANLRIPGGMGLTALALNGINVVAQGGHGGASVFGGGGSGSANNASGNIATVPGSGGGGAGSTPGGGNGSGGAAGEYFELIINNPGATYVYTVGAGGTAGAGGNSGGAGAAGIIIIDEFYN